MTGKFYVRELASGMGGMLRSVDYEPEWDEAFTASCSYRDPTAHYESNTDLKLQLARALSLIEDYYAFSPFRHGVAQRAHGSEFVRSENAQTGRDVQLAPFVLQALKAEFIYGQLGLRFAESKYCVSAVEHQRGRSIGRIAFHGSPLQLDTLETRQSSWVDLNRGIYADGDLPNIRASATTTFPVMRAILHNGRKELQDVSFSLSRRIDGNDNQHWFTSEEALAAVVQSHGYVHGIQLRVAGDFLPTSYDFVRQEYSIFSDRPSLVRIKVEPSDLPPDLYVIAEADAPALKGFMRWENPRQFSDETGIPVRPLGGMWPTINYFPL